MFQRQLRAHEIERVLGKQFRHLGVQQQDLPAFVLKRRLARALAVLL